MTDCARGCLLYGLHIPGCGCTLECPEHEPHCEGCLPREAEIGHYCQKCAFNLRDAIDALPPLIRDVHALPGGSLAPPDRPNNGDPTRRSTKVDQISPSPAHDTADEAARWLHSWAIAVADELSDRGPFEYRRDGIPVPNPAAEARYLTARLAHVCASGYANDLTDEARQLRHRLMRAAGADNADQRIAKPCPHCGRRTLMRPNGEEFIQCRNRECAAAWASDELGLLAREVAAS
jgi:hypothetical protein